MRTLLLIVTCCGCSIALAEEPASNETPAANRTEIVRESKIPRAELPSRFVMASGSVLAMRGSEAERLTNDVKLTDGTILTPGGTVRRVDGTQTQLSDGQAIALDGKLGPLPPGSATTSGVGDQTPAVKPQ